jgi:hypothetical protein
LQELDGPRRSPAGPAEEFQLIGYFLRNTDTPPTVRATLYRAAALIPGIQLLGTVHDHAGRPGLGIAYRTEGEFPGEASTSELIFDPRTGELSGEQGTRPTYWAVYLHEKVVNGLPAPPVPLGSRCASLSGGYTHQVPGGSLSNGDSGTN